ncbi:MAG: DUF6036 family nucleotidyltransferase [Planctomycetes bacterium]|jgi:hypothetical protein|nr:DUF6036 family nucleotidyltransferase [Planctomycetota bacterium]
MSDELVDELRRVLAEIDERAGSLPEPPDIFLVGAGTLVLEGISRRATQDLDFVADRAGDLFVNVVTEAGVHSHRVPAGLVSMARGWRDRAVPLAGFTARHARFLVPALADRLMDKLARGSATDWQDIEAIVTSPACPEPEVVGHRAAEVLADPPSSVFDPAVFRANFDRLAMLYGRAGRRAPEL